MSFKITRLTVGKGKTVGDEKAGVWNREYFELEAELQDESAVELAKGSLEALIDTWLKDETVNTSSPTTPAGQPETKKPKWQYDMEKIVWVERDGKKGKFQLARPEDNADNSDFAVLITALKAQSPTYSKTYLLWLMQDGKAAARKPKVPRA